jgi:hypothetical protein
MFTRRAEPMTHDYQMWQVRSGDQVTGPFTLSELDDLRQRGELTWSHEVSEDGLIWVSASTLKAPPPGIRVNSPDSSASKRLSSEHGGSGRGAAVLFAMVIVAMATGLIWRMRDVVFGYDPQGAEAISRVSLEHASASKEYLEPIRAQDLPSSKARAVAAYNSRLRAVEIADCPVEFQEAFKNRLSALQELHRALDELPDTFLEGLFTGALNGLKRHEADGGTTRMVTSVTRALESVQSTEQEVKKIAATYDVSWP